MSYIEATDTSLRKTGQIKLHGPSGFAGMRKAGALVAKCLDELTDIVKAGVPTSRIDEFVRDFAFSHGAYPATLMYRGYRYSTCTSINHVVCHGMPGDRALKEGDIVNIDVTFIVDGWYGDSSRMYAIGPIARKAERLIEVTYEAMMRGIAAVKPGATTGDIGHAIQSFVEPQGMSVVRDFCGHGLGRMFHDEPNIIHIGRPGEGVMLKPGMFFTIEPMINLGKPHVKILSDGWTAVTRDRSLSAQFEHSVGVTADRRRDLHAVAAPRREAADRGITGVAIAPGGRERSHSYSQEFIGNTREQAQRRFAARDAFLFPTNERVSNMATTLHCVSHNSLSQEAEMAIRERSFRADSSRPISLHRPFASQARARCRGRPVRQQADHAGGRVHVRHRRSRGRRIGQSLRRQFSAERHHRQAGSRRLAVATLHVASYGQHRQRHSFRSAGTDVHR